MVTLIGSEDTAEGLLFDLIELDYDAAEAYEAAINRLENKEYKKQLQKFRSDHIRHTKELSDILLKMGKNIPKGPDMKQFLTQGKVVLANLLGDKAILKAMKTNEDDTNTAYERAVDHKAVDNKLRKILHGNLADERRHRQWIMKEAE